MTQILAPRVTLVWCILILLTSVSLIATHSGMSGVYANGLILSVVFAKGHWMLMDFLKLRRAPAGWKAMFRVWLTLVTLAPWALAALPLLGG
ncbi:cytochrome C oxidase subunit IV family protein [Microvirga sp. G4-2]|uniref:cytochrome C oxidase subunit IV family protein n=1 Tax=Microvirga sp. G4-2 TaxID=3434467 RepID=UPI004043C2BC